MEVSTFKILLFSVMYFYLLVVSTHLKNISQIGSFPQIGVNIKICQTTTQLYFFIWSYVKCNMSWIWFPLVKIRSVRIDPYLQPFPNQMPQGWWLIIFQLACPRALSLVVCCLMQRKKFHTSHKLVKHPKKIQKVYVESSPICSMRGISTYIWLFFMVNVGNYNIHGS